MQIKHLEYSCGIAKQIINVAILENSVINCSPWNIDYGHYVDIGIYIFRNIETSNNKTLAHFETYIINIPNKNTPSNEKSPNNTFLNTTPEKYKIKDRYFHIKLVQMVGTLTYT